VTDLIGEYAVIIERLDALFSKGLEADLTPEELREVEALRARALVIDTEVANRQRLHQPFEAGARV
jgi:hypothetical protein